MNKQLEYIKANGGIIALSVVSLAASFAAGYAVRANKYEKIVVDEEGNVFDENGETIVKATIETPDEVPEEFSKNLGTIHNPETSDARRAFIEGVAAEQKAIREELVREGTGIGEYDTIIDDGFPTYPSGRPDPRDIVLKKDVVEEIHWDAVQEEEMRVNKKIFVIHREEFFEDDTPDIAVQSTLTYYPLDDILVDEDDTPIPNRSKVIGELMFGKGSGDPNVFYVRNLELHAEYEVIHNEDSSYMEDVLGITQAESSA